MRGRSSLLVAIAILSCTSGFAVAPPVDRLQVPKRDAPPAILDCYVVAVKEWAQRVEALEKWVAERKALIATVESTGTVRRGIPERVFRNDRWWYPSVDDKAQHISALKDECELAEGRLSNLTLLTIPPLPSKLAPPIGSVEVDGWGIAESLTVVQVAGDNEMLAQFRSARHPLSDSVWVRGFPTEKFVDDKTYDAEGLVWIVVGTHRYETPLGVSRQVPAVEPLVNLGRWLVNRESPDAHPEFRDVPTTQTAK